MSNTPGRAAKVVLVYFLGGCSYSEISGLRFLGKQTGKMNARYEKLVIIDYSTSWHLKDLRRNYALYAQTLQSPVTEITEVAFTRAIS